MKRDESSVAIAPSLDGTEADLVRALDLGRHFAVVSDTATREVLGARVERALCGLGRVTSIVLPGRPHPDDETVERIRSASAAADALVAIGSGTINDLCKYASAQEGKPYLVFATAPSMNGYTSINAAITVHGHKRSLNAQAPAGVFLDLSILAATDDPLGAGRQPMPADGPGGLAVGASSAGPALPHDAVRPAGRR